MSSTWDVRNNSGNISAVLNPPIGSDWSFPHPQRKTTVVSDHPRNAQKTLVYCGDCYCQKPPVLPKLKFKAPDEEAEVVTSPRIKRIRPCECCCCGDEFKCCPTSNPCCCHLPREPFSYKRWRSKHFTTPRRVYENFRTSGSFEEEYLKELENCNRLRDKSAESKTSFSKEETGRYCENFTKIHTLDTACDIEDNLKKLNTFRKENYFDCHASVTEPKVPEHKCLHKFTLNDRLIPQALNADPFGMSRCVICQKPMKSCVRKEGGSNGGCVEGEQIVNSKVLRVDVEGRVASKINIAGRNEQVEVQVPLDVEKCRALFECGGRIRKPVPTNSIALRYQKGVV